jgi:Bacterial SH3 domain
MAEKSKRSFWLNIETIIIGIFFLFFIVWAMRKCNDESRLRLAGDSKYQEQRLRDSIAKAQRNAPPPAVIPTPAPAPVTMTSTTNVVPPMPTPQSATQQRTSQPAIATPAPTTPQANSQLLWVIIDGLNVRDKPELKGKSFGKLKLHDRVTFLGDVTKSTQKLSLGTEEADEPWVKIKTKRGTVGWVYGAGVSYYKTKKKGTF